MENKNNIKISLLSVLLILTVIIIIIMTYFIYKFYNEKTKAIEELNQLSNKVNILENTIENLQEKENTTSNTINSSTLNNTTIQDIEINNDNDKNINQVVKYEFSSSDRLASQGNPGIFKIFKLTDTQMEFEYNHGWDFIKSSIDRKISGTAEINDENLYEFNENVDDYKYTITIKFSEEMITVYEYSDGELISQINLWS